MPLESAVVVEAVEVVEVVEVVMVLLLPVEVVGIPG